MNLEKEGSGKLHTAIVSKPLLTKLAAGLLAVGMFFTGFIATSDNNAKAETILYEVDEIKASSLGVVDTIFDIGQQHIVCNAYDIVTEGTKNLPVSSGKPRRENPVQMQIPYGYKGEYDFDITFDIDEGIYYQQSFYCSFYTNYLAVCVPINPDAYYLTSEFGDPVDLCDPDRVAYIFYWHPNIAEPFVVAKTTIGEWQDDKEKIEEHKDEIIKQVDMARRLVLEPSR